MFNLQGSEIIFILLLALVVLGPEKLPGAIRKATQTYAEFRKMSSGFQTELKSALDEPMREMRETADLIRDQADPSKIVADDAASSDAERMREERERMRPADELTDATKPRESAETAPADTGIDATSDATVVDVDDVDEWADPVDLDEPDDVTTESVSNGNHPDANDAAHSNGSHAAGGHAARSDVGATDVPDITEIADEEKSA